MARISSYGLDGKPELGDKVVGTDTGAEANLRTKNYSLQEIVDLFNKGNSLAVADQSIFLFQDNLQDGREAGTISFASGGGIGTDFSVVTSILLSKTASGGKVVTNFLQLFNGKDIILAEVGNINNFGQYRVSNIAEYIPDTNFYEVTLFNIAYNGVFSADAHYIFGEFSSPGSLSTPWNIIPDGISYTAANVGIGTVTPSEKLEVSGGIIGDTLFVRNTDGYNAKLLSDNLTTNKTFNFPDVGGTLALTTDITASPWDTVTGGINYANGNVGVGTTSPSTTLDVAGSITTSGAITGPALFEIIAQYTNRGRITLSSSTSTNANQISLLTNGNVRMVVNKEGNVGIGTTSPSEKLDVEGDIASQGIYVDRTHESGGISNPFAKFGLHYWWGDSNSINLQKTGNNNRCAFSTQSGYFHVVNASGNNVRITSSDQTVEVGSGILNLGVVQHSAANNNNGKYISISNAGNTSGSRGVVNVNGDFRINDYSTSAEIEKIKLKNDGSAYFTGNVGIGTTSPSEKLDVAGQYGNTTLSGHVLGFTRAAGNYLWAKASGGDLRFTVNGNPIGSASMIISSSGNVGIGTTTPLELLHLESTEPLLRFDDTNSGLHYIVGQDGDGFKFTMNNSTYGKYTFDSKVGIGTTSPSEKLDVAGNITLSGQILAPDGTAANPSITFVNEAGTPNTGIFRSSENVIGVSSGGLDYLFQGNVFKRNTGGGVYINSQGTTAASPMYSFESYTGNGMFRPIGVNELAFSTASNERLRINSSGNVGIGTTSPAEKLEVIGKILIKGDQSYTYGSEIYSNNMESSFYNKVQSQSSAILSIIGDGTFKSRNVYAGANIGSFGNGQNVTIGAFAYGNVKYMTGHNSYNHTFKGAYSNDLMTILGSGNVGIGTTSPSEKLDVEGNIKLSNSSQLMWRNAADNGNIPIIQLDGTNVLNIGTTSSSAPSKVAIHTGSVERLRVDSSGNVGIGTTSPDKKLDLTVNASDDGLILQTSTGRKALEFLVDNGINGRGIINFYTSTSLLYGRINANSEGLVIDTIANRHMIFNKAGVEVMRISTSGNVGIGTASPSEKLYVAGSIGLNTGQSIKWGAGATKITGIDGSYISFYPNNSEKVRFLANGNVGIGTTSPSQKLEVDGQVLSDGYRLAAMQTAPATRNSTGTPGEIVIDGNHIYVCYATDSWSRVALETSW